MFEAITVFKGEHYFLSNFYSAPVVFEGVRYENNEAAFQAAKCPSRKHEFCNLNPSEAKRLGRQVELRPDWERVKYDIMYRICKEKFMQNHDLRVKLIGTKDAELIEGNDWNDTIWGVCNGVGENHLEFCFECFCKPFISNLIKLCLIREFSSCPKRKFATA